LGIKDLLRSRQQVSEGSDTQESASRLPIIVLDEPMKSSSYQVFAS
jgi:hypothetical protein